MHVGTGISCSCGYMVTGAFLNMALRVNPMPLNNPGKGKSMFLLIRAPP